MSYTISTLNIMSRSSSAITDKTETKGNAMSNN